VTGRASSPFTKREDAVARIPGATKDTVTLANHDVRSRFFEARVRLRLDDTLIEEHSLILRNGMTTLVQWRERVAAQ
jgi:general secretion pathway protein K